MYCIYEKEKHHQSKVPFFTAQPVLSANRKRHQSYPFIKHFPYPSANFKGFGLRLYYPSVMPSSSAQSLSTPKLNRTIIFEGPISTVTSPTMETAEISMPPGMTEEEVRELIPAGVLEREAANRRESDEVERSVLNYPFS